MDRTAADQLEDLRAHTLGDCTRCALHSGRTKVVFGAGNPHASLMLVGYAPNRDSDQVGRPLVGASGTVLDRILKKAQISREDAYLANVVKCASSGDTAQKAVASCSPFLREQIKIISPKVLVALGRDAGNTLTGQRSPLTLDTLRERAYWTYDDDAASIPVVVTHTPERVWGLLKTGSTNPAKKLFGEILGDIRRALAMSRPVNLDL